MQDDEFYTKWLETHFIQVKMGLYYPAYTDMQRKLAHYHLTDEESPERYHMEVQAQAALLLHYREYRLGERQPGEVEIQLPN